MTEGDRGQLRLGNRRCLVHNYTSRSIYLITIEVLDRKQLLGVIRKDKVKPALMSVKDMSESELLSANAGLFKPSLLGKVVADEFMKIGEHVAGVKPLVAQAMPDHFHGILFVTRQIDRRLGSIIGGFKAKCSHIAHEFAVKSHDLHWLMKEGTSLWEAGFHDRILTTEGQLEKMIRYVIDNPRRAALRLCNRELFTKVRCMAGHGRSFDAYGNTFLLRRPEIVQIQCSRKFFGYKRVEKRGVMLGKSKLSRVTREVAFSTPEFVAKRDALFEAAKRGAVLCSPCISDGEKAIAYAAVDAGLPLIVLRSEPFPARFKPSGRFFDACAGGHLLILYPRGPTPCAPNRTGAVDHSRGLTPCGCRLGGSVREHTSITREECLALNAIATEICNGSWV